MYNYHRWYPNHKVVFMAPSKPLVAQQLEACCEIMGIHQSLCAQLNGKIKFERESKTVTAFRKKNRSGRPVIKIGPKGALGSHEIRPIHSAPSLGQSTAENIYFVFDFRKYQCKYEEKPLGI